jgi:hypothetical protein
MILSEDEASNLLENVVKLADSISGCLRISCNTTSYFGLGYRKSTDSYIGDMVQLLIRLNKIIGVDSKPYENQLKYLSFIAGDESEYFQF